MATRAALKRIENLIWALVYGGMLTGVLGLAVRGASAGLGHGMVVVGAIVAVAGVVLIFVRARMTEDA
jgi:hypothetical protein